MRITMLAAGLLLANAMASETPGAEEPSPEATMAAMQFLAGSWSGDMGGGVFRAYYTTSEGLKVLSYSELLRGGEVVFHEFELFEVQGDDVVFRPFPGGRPAPPLKLTQLDAADHRVTFENPEKDFPTRIVYQRVAPDRLVITLSDPYSSEGKIQQFDLRRLP